MTAASPLPVDLSQYTVEDLLDLAERCVAEARRREAERHEPPPED